MSFLCHRRLTFPIYNIIVVVRTWTLIGLLWLIDSPRIKITNIHGLKEENIAILLNNLQAMFLSE